MGTVSTPASIDDLLDAPSPLPPPPPKRKPEDRPKTVTPVHLQVVWGDLARVPADVHVVGHYMGVMPTSAEGALDKAISGTDDSRRIIAEHTRRQWFLGDFGHVNYFPSVHDVVKIAAVAGMGRPGTFTEARAKRLAESLLVELCALGSAKRVATVGIGSGAGNLSIDQAARALAGGFADALESSRMKHPCTHISVVEWDRLRAERFLVAFRTALAGLEHVLSLNPDLESGADGGVSFTSASVYALSALAQTEGPGADPPQLTERLERMGGSQLPTCVMDRLREVNPAALLNGAEVSLQQPRGDDMDPVRISVLEDADRRSMRVAAITGTATVPERQIDADPKLIDEIVRRMSPPDPDDLPWLADLMSRMVLPSDLQTLVSADAPLLFEVDRRTAQIHWELVADLVHGSSWSTAEGPEKPLVLQTPVSRQLRTTYSRVPALEAQTASALNVLVIGDPGEGVLSLREARVEAEAVYAALFAMGINVTALIGAPANDVAGVRAKSAVPVAPAPDRPPPPRPAGRLDVLRELLSGNYQIVHYCGHGTIDPDDQRRAGWVFADGLLTSRELAQLGTPPRLVVANACFTSRLGGTAPGTRTSTALATGSATGGTGTATGTGTGREARPKSPVGGEAQLTPSLADEFFKSGVANYVGAAWKVSDADARLFSTTFYAHLLGPAKASLGAALTAGRLAVWEGRVKAGGAPGTTWAAYQHYGDPTDRMVVGERGGDGAA